MRTRITHPIKPMSDRELANELAAIAYSDDSLATTFEPIPCQDCQTLGVSALACASRRHHA